MYHFLTASTSYYKGNSFDELLKEEQDFKYVYWDIYNHCVSKGDICYIYYSNLPDESSRILFRAEVIDSDYPSVMKDKPNKFKDSKCAKLKMKPISLENKEMFSLEKLRNKYNLISQKGQFSYLHVYESKHKNLIDDIELLNKNNKKTLSTANRYFNERFCSCIFGCKSFIEENGFYYIQRHHLVERNLLNRKLNIEGLELLIENDENKFNLCPLCHAKVHHAKKDVKMKMIKELYEKRKNFFDKNFNELKNNKKTLEWLYDMYKCNK